MSRIQSLIDLVEGGEMPTAEHLRRVATLQSLDAVRHGEIYIAEAQAKELDADERFEQLLSTENL